MNTVIFWFRQDLRLHDQHALRLACTIATHVLPVYCHTPPALSAWGFPRVGVHRLHFVAAALQDLKHQLAVLNNPLVECYGSAVASLLRLAEVVGADTIVCEAIAAPEEEAEVTALRAAGLTVHCVWQSSLLDPADLPWASDALPSTFSAFRQAIERAHIDAPPPLSRVQALPPPPPRSALRLPDAPSLPPLAAGAYDQRSSFPYGTAAFAGGESAALAHLTQYLRRQLPHSYKQTRNALSGLDYSSKWSPWLASGALSARYILAELRQFEAQHGANEGSYWLWFELLWRDYFRFLHRQYGARLYGARGLHHTRLPAHNAEGFQRWCTAQTGEPLIDAAMRELAHSGYLSNRLRQVVASYLIYQLGGDWRAGAAWFEAQLIDYDVYSNQGNWLYIAGRGTDPRGGRQFNLAKQAAEHDPQGSYQQMWQTR